MSKYAVYFNYQIKKDEQPQQKVDRFDTYDEAVSFYDKKISALSLCHTLWKVCMYSLVKLNEQSIPKEWLLVKNVGGKGESTRGENLPEWLK